MTRAQDEMKRWQAQCPPRLGGGYVDALWLELAPDTPQWAHEMRARGHLVVGEVGVDEAAASTASFDDGSHAIAMNTGLTDFIYAFARALASSANIEVNGRRIPESLARQNAVAEVRRVYDTFREYAHVYHGGYPVHREHVTTADELSRCSELFVLSHELGHVSLKEGKQPPRVGSAEMEADAFAIEVLTRAGPRMKHRMLYAGAFFAARSFGIVERLGLHPAGIYPPVTQRIEAMAREVERLLGEERSLQALHIAVAADEGFEGMEIEVAGGDPTGTPQTPLRVGVRLRGMLEQAVKDRWTAAKLGDELYYGFKGVPRELLVEVLRKYAATSGKSDVAAAQRHAAVGALDAAILRLPEGLRAAFVEGRAGR